MRHKISQFCSTYSNVVRRSKSGDEYVLEKETDECRGEYRTHFNLYHAWRILSIVKKWQELGIPTFWEKQCKIKSKLSKTSQSTSFNTSESSLGGFNLNNAMDQDEDEDDEEEEENEVWEVWPMGRDKANKKLASSTSSSAGGNEGFVNMLVKKWANDRYFSFFNQTKQKVRPMPRWSKRTTNYNNKCSTFNKKNKKKMI